MHIYAMRPNYAQTKEPTQRCAMCGCHVRLPRPNVRALYMHKCGAVRTHTHERWRTDVYLCAVMPGAQLVWLSHITRALRIGSTVRERSGPRVRVTYISAIFASHIARTHAGDFVRAHKHRICAHNCTRSPPRNTCACVRASAKNYNNFMVSGNALVHTIVLLVVGDGGRATPGSGMHERTAAAAAALVVFNCDV